MQRAICTLISLVLLGGCGGDGGLQEEPVVGPLPTGSDDARAYSEDFLADNPRALAQLEHVLLVQLEPTEAGDEEGDTCKERDGVDCIPYVVDEPTALTLSIDESGFEIAHLTLRDEAGSEVLSLAAGEEPVTAVIAPGEYILELTHAFAGDAGAETPTIFLRPGEAGEAETDAAVAQWADVAEEARAARQTTPPRAMSLTAGRDCVRCSFANSNLTDQHFDGANLTGSTFRGAKFYRTTLRGATLIGCTMTDLRSGSLDTPEGGNLKDGFDADFSDAKAPGVHFSFAFERLGGGVEFAHLFFGIFRGATLDNTLWHQADEMGLASELRPDFRNASLRGAHFSFIRLTRAGNCPSASRARQDTCTFQGADLTAAVFDDIFWNSDLILFSRVPTRLAGSHLAHCRFDIEPTSGRITTLREANLLNARLAGVDFSNADLSGAVLDGLDLENQIDGCEKGGTMAGANLTGAHLKGAILEGVDLSRAKLSRAEVAGVRWRGTNFTDAVITGMMPATFNDLDLTGSNLSGVDFAGFDLTRTDLSRAVLSVPPRFSGAKLSDGTRGVNIAGHGFPPRYELFKGADLTGVDFSRTELFAANLERTTLNSAKLVGANLNFANLRGAKLRGATLGVQPGSEAHAATLRGAFMPDIDLSDADLRSVDLTRAHLYGSQTLLVRTRLDSATFVNAICSGAHFSGSLNNAVFVGAQLVNTIFNGATLTNTKFDDAYLQGADFSAATSVTGAGLSNAAVSAVAGTWSFTEQDGTPFTVRYEATKLGPLGTDRSVRCPDGTQGPCCPSGNVAACLGEKLRPVRNGPFPPVPECVPKPPQYDNCITPQPTTTPTPRRG